MPCSVLAVAAGLRTPCIADRARLCVMHQERNATLPREDWEADVERSFEAVERRLPALRLDRRAQSCSAAHAAEVWWASNAARPDRHHIFLLARPAGCCWPEPWLLPGVAHQCSA